MPIAVLISGSGSNLQALINAEQARYRIVVVISDRPDVQGLQRAQDAGITTELVSWDSFASREAFSAAVCNAAQRHGAKALVLAGFMRILSPQAIERFPDAIINVHPSLLPAFPGAHAVENALEAGVATTGVSVHLVDEQVDHGPIIAQEIVHIEEGDDVLSLHGRIQQVEHRLLPEVVDAFALGAITVDGGDVRWDRSLRESTRS